MLNLNNEYQGMNRFKLLRTSPKDDLECLCNMLLSLGNSYDVVDLVYPEKAKRDPAHKIAYLQEYKKNYSLDRIC